MGRPRLRVALGILIGCTVACAGLLATLLAVVHPEHADPTIVRPGPKRVTRTIAAEEEGCPVRVEVRTAEGDIPAETTVEVWGGPLGPEPLGAHPVDASGRAVLRDAPCSRILVRADAPGYPPRSEVVEEGPRDRTVVLTLVAGVRVYGHVTETDGTAIEGAEVHGGLASTTSDADGAYDLWIVPDVKALGASAFSHEDAWVALDVPEGADEFQADIQLDWKRQLRVWCAGLPDDDCGDVAMQCTSPWLVIGDECRYDEDKHETLCECPDGQVAVRGGGRSVLVDEDAEEAWLDFRDAGAIVGKVLVSGAPPLPGHVTALRVPTALEDLPRGLVAGHRVTCEPDGAFRLEGLVEGDWELVAEASAEWGESSHQRVLVPLHVARAAEVDVGTIEVLGGGAIEGTLIDGITGEPSKYGTLLAIRSAGPGERFTVAGEGAEEDGKFRIEGLPAGTWSVAPPTSPQEYVEVVVREGQTTSGVEVRTSDATALAENGFSLSDDEDGRLLVSDVEPGGPADEAGLEPGEEIVGVRLGGFDLGNAVGEGRAVRMVLGHWDGPGVTLVVRGEQGEELVPLDW